MGNFHNVNVSSHDDEHTWVIAILEDIVGIRQKLAPYKEDFMESILFVENESKKLFRDLHFTYVHGDFRPANIIFNQIEGKYYLIDFENFMVGDPTLDLYKMLSVLKSNENYNNEDVILNSISHLTERTDTITIRKTDEVEYYSVTDQEDVMIKTIIFVVPVLIIGMGVVVWAVRRRSI